jgi:hypothetical protein
VRIALAGGGRLERDVPHAIGSLEKPMADRDLEVKFRELAAGIGCDAAQIIQQVWALEQLDDVSKLTAPLRSP